MTTDDAAPNPAGTSNESQPDPQDSGKIIEPGAGAVLVRPPNWILTRNPDDPLTPEEERQVEAFQTSFFEATKRMKEDAQFSPRVLEALPGWMYEKLPRRGQGITPKDKTALRAHFEKHYPELIARLDPVKAVGGWRYGAWWHSNHGRPPEPIPPRSQRAIELTEAGLDVEPEA